MVDSITSEDLHFFKRLEHKLLGKGSFGSVYEAIDFRHPEIHLAVKVIDLSRFPEGYRLKFKKNVEEEVNILNKLNHENIVKIRKLIMTSEGNKINIFMDKCDTDILGIKSNKPENRFSEEETLYFFKRISKAMLYVQKRKILHRDIKPANILIIDNQGELIPKICDFGFGAIVQNVENPTNHYSKLGSPLYKAPQLYLGENYSYKCDVWSTGVMIYELLFGYPPWNSKVQKEDDLFDNNILVKPLNFPISIECSKDFKKILTGMLQLKEEDRIGWEEILKSDLMKDTIPICLGELSQASNKRTKQMIKEMVRIKDFNEYKIHKLGLCELIDKVLKNDVLEEISKLFDVERKIFRTIKFALKKLQMIYLNKIVKLIKKKNNEKFNYNNFESEMKKEILDYFEEEEQEFMKIYENTQSSKSLMRDEEVLPILNTSFRKSKNQKFFEIYEIFLALFLSSIQIESLNQIKDKEKRNEYLTILFILKSISCKGRIKKNFKFYQINNEKHFQEFKEELKKINLEKLKELFNE